MRHLIIFAKNPELGKAKTRLAKTIGAEKALTVYRKLLSHTQSQAAKLARVERTVFYAGYIGENDIWSEKLYHKQQQRGVDLGLRMYRAFYYALVEKRAPKALIIGTDCPGIDTRRLEEAFGRLDDADAVIGPAEDGGYYLLGLKPVSLHTELFEGKPWSTEAVLKETVAEFERLGIGYETLPVLRDIDDENDLRHFPDFLP